MRVTSSHCASGVTIRHDTRLSSAVPHSTAFLPPAFTATLPPMHDASADVGSQANTRRFASATSIARLVTTAAQDDRLDTRKPLELFGIDHRRARVERNRAAGVAGAAAARNDR